MSRNRLTIADGGSASPVALQSQGGVPTTTTALPATTASSYSEGGADSVVFVPAAAAAGTPYCTLFLHGCGGSATAGQQPADGDTLDIADPFGVLAAGTTLVVTGKAGGVGFQIADGAALADSVTLNAAGASRRYVFSGSASAWIRVD
jgi:hypothetical protein